LRSAAEETERLTGLAADLLLIARSDRGHLPIRRERVTTRALFRAAAGRFAFRAGVHGRTIVVSADRGLVIDVDPAHVERALEHLIENARSHGAGRIELSAVTRGDLVELHVTDQGPGLAAPFLPRAFDRFSRADEARSRGGSGLGLSIVDLIAQAHGGEAGAGTRPGGGADVWIAIERADYGAADPLRPARSPGRPSRRRSHRWFINVCWTGRHGGRA
jgi:signal transduction histidine kinase